jgi:hypothetical protein
VCAFFFLKTQNNNYSDYSKIYLGQKPLLRSKTGGYSKATQENSDYSRTDQTARGADSPISGKELWKNENFLLFRIVSAERSINSHG